MGGCMTPVTLRRRCSWFGVPERAVMDIMGWSSSSMAKRYQHLTAQIRKDIAKRVGGLLGRRRGEVRRRRGRAGGSAGTRMIRGN
jgi:hypothetical protein